MPPNSYLLHGIYLSLADKSTFNSAESGIIKQMCGLSKCSWHTNLLCEINLDNVSTVIDNYTKNIGYQILSEYMEDANDSIIPGTIVDRVLKIGLSPIDVLFHNVCDRHDHVFNNVIVDSLHEHFIKLWCCDYVLVKPFTRTF